MNSFISFTFPQSERQAFLLFLFHFILYSQSSAIFILLSFQRSLAFFYHVRFHFSICLRFLLILLTFSFSVCHNGPYNINRSVLIPSFYCIAALYASQTYFLSAFYKNVLPCVEKATAPAAKGIMDRMEDKASWRSSAVKESQFLSGKFLALCEFGFKKICKVLRASLVCHTYAREDLLIEELFLHIFAGRTFALLWSMVSASCRSFLIIIEQKRRCGR